MLRDLNSVDKANKSWLPWQRPLRDRKTNFRLITYSHSSTNPANLAKIGQVDVERNCLKGIVKNKQAYCSRTYSPPGLLSWAGYNKGLFTGLN